MDSAEPLVERPKALFMAFGTKGDVLPLAVLASYFANKHLNYAVTFVTHAAHEHLNAHLSEVNISFYSISTPPVLPLETYCEETEIGLQTISSVLRRRALEYQHRKECLAAVEKHFEKGSEPQSDFIVINFFALEGWHLAELFQVRCVIASPYVIPYSAPSTFEHKFKSIHPLLYRRLHNASCNELSWNDVIHWMWPLFMDHWVSWRKECLHLSPYPLTDPFTGLPVLHNWPEPPLVLYGFSKEIVEFPGYWPANVYACGFWYPPIHWELDTVNHSGSKNLSHQTINDHFPDELISFVMEDPSICYKPIFIGLSSIGSMGYIDNPEGFLLLLKAVLQASSYKIIFLTSGYPFLDSAIQNFAQEMIDNDNDKCSPDLNKNGVLLFNNRLFCYSGYIPYSWLFPKCSMVIHHGGSGATAAALSAGVPQIICPFILDQFYWAERMSWIGVAPPPLKKMYLIPDKSPESISEAANVLLKTIQMAFSEEMKACAVKIAEKLHIEDGVGDAVKILEKKIHLS